MMTSIYNCHNALRIVFLIQIFIPSIVGIVEILALNILKKNILVVEVYDVTIGMS